MHREREKERKEGEDLLLGFNLATVVWCGVVLQIPHGFEGGEMIRRVSRRI